MRSAPALLAALLGCGGAAASSPTTEPSAPDPRPARAAVGELLDGWHEAAAAADEARYFAAFAPDAVFLGTDASERWDVEAFRRYAHPHFERGRAWTFRATRRAVEVAPSGDVAWFDEDLETEGLGPARGSGVAVRIGDRFLIAHYNLAITVPNDRFAEVRALLASPAPPQNE